MQVRGNGCPNSPPFEGGVAAPIKKNIAKHPLKGADGVVQSKTGPPRPRLERNGSIFLVARPPLLQKEGILGRPFPRAASQSAKPPARSAGTSLKKTRAVL